MPNGRYGIIFHFVNVFRRKLKGYFPVSELSSVYQIHLVRKGAMDAVVLQVECDTSLYNEIGEDLKHEKITLLKRKIQHQMKNTCLISVDIVVNPPKTLPRSEGKAIRVVDKREKCLVSV